MRTKVMFTVVAGLLAAGGAWAAHPGTNRRHGVERSQVEAVQRLAHEVEDRARLVHRSAERLAHHGDYREEQALVRLHELEDRARHFHGQVERYGWDLGHTEADFGELSRAYDRAAYAMYGLHAFDTVDRQFEGLSDAMYELESYAGDLFYGPRWSHRDRHDRDDDRDRAKGRHERGHARVVVPRGRASWEWFGR